MHSFLHVETDEEVFQGSSTLVAGDAEGLTCTGSRYYGVASTP